MPTITSYATLTQAILDFTHRPALSTYTDYFIQSAQEEINDDIFAQNFGQGIRYMENAYPPTAITNGVAPVPSDWLSPKDFTITGLDAAVYDLEFKDPQWIYARYPVRAATGIPGYIARDVNSGGGAFPATAGFVTAVAAANQTALSIAALSAGANVLFATLDGAMLVPGIDYTVAGTTLTLANGAAAGQGLYVQGSLPSTALPASGTSQFIFGPYPDSNYTIQGTYYSQAPLLSGGQASNWMVANAPSMLHACCMRQAGKFLKDVEMTQTWTALYNDALLKLIARDTAGRFGEGPLVINNVAPRTSVY